jgi:hypothetical protein
VEEEAVMAGETGGTVPPPSAEDRAEAIAVLTQRFIDAGKGPAESAEVAAAVVDQAIGARAGTIDPGQAGLSS